MISSALKEIGFEKDGKMELCFVESYAVIQKLKQNTTNNEITLFIQGSYANNTNIDETSDVDIAVIVEKNFYPKYREGVKGKDYNFIESNFSMKDFKDDVENALINFFGDRSVFRHNKSIKVRGNLSRVDADVVPVYRYRDYSMDLNFNEDNYIQGVVIIPDEGGDIINYPQQHIEKGVEKNRHTNNNYKKFVRIFKNIKEDMIQSGCYVSNNISSFGIESLLWNIENRKYMCSNDDVLEIFDNVIMFLVDDIDRFDEYLEANGIKLLFNDATIKKEYISFFNEMLKFVYSNSSKVLYG